MTNILLRILDIWYDLIYAVVLGNVFISYSVNVTLMFVDCRKTSDRRTRLLYIQFVLTPGLYPGPGVYAGHGVYQKSVRSR